MRENSQKDNIGMKFGNILNYGKPKDQYIFYKNQD